IPSSVVPRPATTGVSGGGLARSLVTPAAASRRRPQRTASHGTAPHTGRLTGTGHPHANAPPPVEGPESLRIDPDSELARGTARSCLDGRRGQGAPPGSGARKSPR